MDKAQMVDYLTTIRDLRNGTKPHAVVEALILEHGRWHSGTVTPPGVISPIPPEPKQCYANAWRIASIYHDLLYTEGYAAGKVPIPLEHAWLTHRLTGEVFDPTWAPGSPASYFGIAFDVDYIRHHVSDEQRDPSILFNRVRAPFTVRNGVAHRDTTADT